MREYKEQQGEVIRKLRRALEQRDQQLRDAAASARSSWVAPPPQRLVTESGRPQGLPLAPYSVHLNLDIEKALRYLGSTGDLGVPESADSPGQSDSP